MEYRVLALPLVEGGEVGNAVDGGRNALGGHGVVALRVDLAVVHDHEVVRVVRILREGRSRDSLEQGGMGQASTALVPLQNCHVRFGCGVWVE